MVNTGCADCDRNFIDNEDYCPKHKLEYLKIMAEQAQNDYMAELKAQSRKVKNVSTRSNHSNNAP